MNVFKKFAVIASALVLVACGGGGGNPGTTPGSTGTAKVASFDYQLDKFTLTNSGGDEANLVVTALDASNTPVADATVAVKVDSGIYTPTTTTTDATGKVSGVISIGGDKTNRNIGVSITVGGQTKSDVVSVTGSQLTVSATPAIPSPGSVVNLSIKVIDVNNAGIPNAVVKLAGSLGFTGSVKADSSGTAVATLAAAPTSPGNYTIEVTSSGVTAVRDVQVVGASGGVPDAVGVISAAALAITPNTIPPNAPGANVNRAGLRAIFQDASNRAIKNVRVRFEIVPPGLGAGESIFTGSDIVYTDINGIANSDYIAGTRSSPTGGVTIRACYGMTDAELAGMACPNSRTATMTVAAEPLSITLGDNNKLERGDFELTYIKKFDVAVADSAGNPVPSAKVSMSVDLIDYGKGPAYNGLKTWCLNEDTNRNGLLDAGEDRDGDGVLTPRKADVVISSVNTSQTTGANGRMAIQVEYPQNVATWLRYAVKVTTSVSGSEGTAEKQYITSFIEGDEINGSFLIPPYGVNACNTPN